MPDEAQVVLKWRLGLPLTPDGTPAHFVITAWMPGDITCPRGFLFLKGGGGGGG